ncbi:MAG: NUDIX domain-containing protein [Candidatus Babeliales bacterium]|nr:NUDIX domain-containing protein [Candidatus Babeliales bacterium]
MSLKQRSQYFMTVDCVIFGYSQGQLMVALIERKNEPFKGKWAIPGGFVEGDETVDEAAARELQEETGLHDIYLEQFHVFSDPERDPRGRVITVAFFALINSDQIELVATEDALEAKWYPAYNIPDLAFDHNAIYEKALEELRLAVSIKPLVFELLPGKFTLTMLQNIYEQIFGFTIDKRNFRKKILKMDFIQETKYLTKGDQQRPAKLYQFNKKRFIKNDTRTVNSIFF